jgi:hypothetical protein
MGWIAITAGGENGGVQVRSQNNLLRIKQKPQRTGLLAKPLPWTVIQKVLFVLGPGF